MSVISKPGRQVKPVYSRSSACPVFGRVFSVYLSLVGWLFAGSVTANIDLTRLPDTEVPLATAKFLSAEDGEKLAYRQYIPRNAKASVVLLHGVGFHSGIGLQHLAFPLAAEHDVAVYTPDLRGHGRSAGDALSPGRVNTLWQDMDTVLNFVRSQDKVRPLVIVAHSSAARVLLNYMAWKVTPRFDGIVFIAPDLGESAELYRSKESNYYESVLLGSLTGKLTFGFGCSGCVAGKVQHSNENTFAHPGLVKEYNFAFAKALALSKPYMAVRRLRIPFAMIAGSSDEYIQGGRTKMYFKQNGRTPWMRANELIKGASHFSVLTEADDLVAKFIDGLDVNGS